MYSFLRYIEPFIYLVSFALIIKAYSMFITSQHRYLSIKIIRHNSLFSRLKLGLTSYLHNEHSEKMFKDAGFPLKLTGASFSLLRLILCFLTFGLIISKWLWANTPFPTSSIGLLTAAFALTSPENRMPLTWLLDKLKEINKTKKNKECFLLYNMLLNEFYSEEQKPYNMYSILQKFSNYFDEIRPSIVKTLSAWKRNPEQALNIFADEIGTEEASDLAQILKSINNSSAEQARDIIKNRYEQFQTSRHEQHRRKLKNLDLIGYIAVFIPTMAILFNMVSVLGIAVQSLLQRLNYH